MLANSAFDKLGFLRRLSDWTPEVAEQLAASEGIALREQHWELISLIRQYYEEFDSSPAMRPLVKYTAINLGANKGKSMYLLSLFPNSPAKICSKIAGLPKPDNCL
ncbi:MAG: TusE/DsrC/DsvC family sulfur relay protein [Proteobacteria bacterium]|nr:TusE/DsrC/DsvC family sulfur relay protein [Pseudomonadota bacterium]